jgi:PAS domain S-box-containing protein
MGSKNLLFNEDHTSLTRILILFFIAMLIITFLYELLKQLLFPDITLWESHAITILFTGIVSVVILFFPLRRLFREQETTKAVLIRQNETEKKLRQSEAQYRTFIESAAVSIFTVDRDLRYLLINAQHVARLGLPPGDYTGKTYGDFHSKEKTADFEEKIRRIIGTRKPLQYEYSSEGKEYFRKLSPVIDPADDTVIAVTIVSSDITDRKRTEEELRLFKASVDGAFDEVFWLDFQGNIIYVNDSASRNTGYPREELLTMTILHLDPELTPALVEIYHADLRRNKSRVFITKHRNSDGVVRDVEVMANYVVRNGKEYIFEFIHDITARKKAEDAIREQERFLNDILSAIRDGISVTDPSMTILRTNKTMEQWYHGSVPLAGKRCYEAFHHRHGPCDSCPVQKTLETGRSEHALLTIKEGGKTAGWAEVFSYPMVSPETGKITGVIEYVRDVTEQKSLEYTYEHEMDYYTAELRRYVETLATTNNKLNLLNNVTRHDILNTITGLLGTVDMALEAGTQEERTMLLHDIRGLGEIVQKQIEFTRQYQNIGMQAAEWYDVRTTITSAAGQLPLAGISLEISVGDLAIYADPLIGKVFYNILENSLRHGEHVTAMSFGFRKSARDRIITFSDNGVGVPADMKEKIFLQGFGKHTGLGMYLARAILSITRISISETGEPGKGARFEIVIPEGAYREPGVP